MKNASKRTLLLIIMLIVVLSVSAYATKMDIIKSEIIFHDGSKLSFATKSNNNAEEILKENNIVLLDDEVIKESNEGDKKIIYIDKKNSNENIVKSENFKEISSEVIRNDNSSIIEKIEIETIEIPFNTITKESKNQDNTRSMVIQIGENGIKEIKYKSIYKNQELIDRKILEEKVTKEPKDKIVQLVPKVTSRSLSRVNIPPGEARAAFEQVCAEKGVSASERNAWAELISRESGWRTTATNRGTGAYGLPQSLPGRKMATHGSDWRTNPRTQLRWMYDYTKGRYDSFGNALSIQKDRGWY